METARRWRRLALVGALAALGVVGVTFARTPEDGVRLHSDSLTARTGSRVPVLWIEPAGAVRGTALLTHGITASKETLRPLGEALALAGYRCCLVDLPGHGASRAPRTPVEVAATYSACAVALARGGEPPRVDVLAGHSFGAITGGRALAGGHVAADVFIAIGARADPGHGAARTVFVSGVEDELLRPEELRRHAVAVPGEVVLVPRCDHVLEPYHPGVIAATLAAVAPDRAAAVRPRAGRWRLLGWSLLAAVVLAALILVPVPRLTGGRAAIVGAIFALCAALLVTVGLHGVVVSAAPTPARLMLAAALAAVALAVSGGAALTLNRLPRLGIRWAGTVQALLVTVALILVVVQAQWGERFFALMYALLALLMVAGAVAGSILERRIGSPWAGHSAFAVVVGYAAGVWLGSLVA